MAAARRRLEATAVEKAFPTRLLHVGAEQAGGPAGPPDPLRINQFVEGDPDGARVMTDEEVARLLNDPMAMLVLRRGQFPRTLGELLDALDQHNASPEGLREAASFLVSEGGQLRFKPGVDKGGSRLLVVRSRRNQPELVISTLIPPDASPRLTELLVEVMAWDPSNRTFHYYQRQAGAWFWCGQSDMALEEPTAGKGPFDSHASGYPVMKELKEPWVHWHGRLTIAETAYAPDDPLVADPLFTDKSPAESFEKRVMRPLCERWNVARFEKALDGERLTRVPQFFRQVVGSPAANLVSTSKPWSAIDRDGDLEDVPATFFVDLDCLGSVIGLSPELPTLVIERARYRTLVETHDLRVRDGSVDQRGDVPFCFTVPERALEDVLVVKILVRRGVLSRRLAACLLMTDFPNAVGSPRRASLLQYVPETSGRTETTNLDTTLAPAIVEAAETSPDGSAEREFVGHWELGPREWEATFTDRITVYLRAVAAALKTDAGSDAIFRLAESRRREFRRRPLAEFGLSLPQAVGIPDGEAALEMTETAIVQRRHLDRQE